jgi:hypothetical protein
VFAVTMASAKTEAEAKYLAESRVIPSMIFSP